LFFEIRLGVSLKEKEGKIKQGSGQLRLDPLLIFQKTSLEICAKHVPAHILNRDIKS
jgi:hypothetical protein